MHKVRDCQHGIGHLGFDKRFGVIKLDGLSTGRDFKPIRAKTGNKVDKRPLARCGRPTGTPVQVDSYVFSRELKYALTARHQKFTC